MDTSSSVSESPSSGEVIINPQETHTEMQTEVSPIELERKLHELLEARQQERILELEARSTGNHQAQSSRERIRGFLVERHCTDYIASCSRTPASCFPAESENFPPLEVDEHQTAVEFLLGIALATFCILSSVISAGGALSFSFCLFESFCYGFISVRYNYLQKGSGISFLVVLVQLTKILVCGLLVLHAYVCPFHFLSSY